MADNKQMKRSNSQVFDDSDLKEDTDTNHTGRNRRTSSWAFWKTTDGENGIHDKPDDPMHIGNEESSNKTDDLDRINSNLKSSNKSDNVKSVVVDGKVNDVSEDNKQDQDQNQDIVGNSKRDRSSSWSFWSSTAKNYNQSTLLNHSSDPKPDFVKSDISKSTNNSDKVEQKQNSKTQLNKKTSLDSLYNNSNNNTTNNNNSKDKRGNLLLPKIEDNLPLLSTQNVVLNGFKRFRKIMGYNNERDTNLFRKEEPTIFKRVLIIGVHGFFPTKMIRPIIGEPTGTSMRFAQVGETAVLQWAKENNLNIEIQKIALEKEGKIFDRVDFFFDILKNSINDIKKSDFIFICAHSQGTPVSVMLISKLLEYDIIDSNKRVGILGMAGINLGPFYGMDKSFFVRALSKIENESLLELFQFQNFESLQSRKYIESIKNLVRHNVKITFVGSIDDQLVPLYSSIALHVQHPNLYRAVYIDGSTNTPDFLTRIIKISCMLQNIALTDHDFIKEISTALAGPITGGGHSKIYNELKVYKLALDFTLKTQDSNIAIEQPVMVKPFDIKKHGSGANPFNLPWCTRGLFFEASRNLTNGKEEMELVFKEFEEWHPDSKVLKDVKYRLNGIRAKL